MSQPSSPATRPPALGAPAPRRMPRVVRWGLRVLYLLGVVLAAGVLLLAGWFRSEDFQRRATSLVEALVEEATGEECTITSIRPGLWPPAVNVDGLHLYHGPTSETIVSAALVRVPLVLRDGGAGIGRLDISRPVIQLHVEADGKLREFRGRPARVPSTPRKPLTRLPWSSIRVTDGTIRISHPQGHVFVENLALAPVAGPVTDIRADLDLAVRGLTERTRLDLPGVVIGPEVVDIPSLVLDTKAIQLRARGRIPLAGPLDVDASAHVELEEINPLLTPPRKAHGSADLDVRVEGSTRDPVAWVNVRVDRLGLDLPGKFTRLLTYELGDIAAAIVADKRQLRIEKANVRLAEGTLSTWGTVSLPDLVLHDGHVVADRVSLEQLLVSFDAAPTPWIDMSTDLEITWSGPLKPLQLDGTFDIGVARLQVGDRPISAPGVQLMLDIPHAYARGDLTLYPDRIHLVSDDVAGPRNRGSLDLEIGFGPRGPLDLRAELSPADLALFQPLKGVELTGTGRVAAHIQGEFNRLRLDGEGDVRGFSVMGIPYADHLVADIVSPEMKTLELRNAVARRGVSDYHGNFRMDFRPPMSMDTDVEITTGRVEDLVGMFIELPGLRGDLQGTLSLHGPLYEMDGESHLGLANLDLWGERFESGWGHGYLDGGLFTLDDLTVHRNQHAEGLTLRGSVERKWKLDMELVADGLALQRLDRLADADLPLSGNLAGHARITGTLFEPSPDGRISITDVRYAGNAAEDSVIQFDSTDGVMAYAASLLGGAATVDGTLGLWGEQPYRMVADLDAVPAHLFYPIAADGGPIRATASGSVELSGHFGERWSPVSMSARLDEVEVAWADHVLRNTSPWVYTQEGRKFELRDFSLSSRTAVARAGDPSPPRGPETDLTISASGGDYLDLSGSGTVDLDLLRALVPGVQRSSGTAEVLLYATGTRPHVEAVVELSVDAELFRHASIPATFEDVEARARITDHSIELLEFESRLGGGTLLGSGHVDAEHWLPTRYDLSIDVTDAQVQWVESLPPAIGDAHLRFDGPSDALLLSGEVRVDDMTFSDRIDWEDWVVEYRDEMLVDPASSFDAEPYFSMNVGIVADRSIVLRNNVAEGTASGDLRIIGDTARPGLVGDVRINEAVVFLQDREFQVDRGNLLFNDPWTWDPDLDIQLVTDIDNRDQRYRVTYQVMGPFSNWRSTTRSDPPLAQSDVNALLWFGVTMEDLEEMGELSSAVAQGVADMLLTDFLITNQAGEISEAPQLLFDRIDLATGVNGRGEYSPEPRLLVEKDFSDLDTTVIWELNLLRPEDNYVRADKRIGGIWSLSGWYARLQRDRVLPLGGAYGLDVTARWETD